MIQVEKLEVFLSSISDFFAQIDDTPIAIDTPYLHDNKQLVGFDYSGMIKISGPIEGYVYVSAPTIMLREVLSVMREADNSLSMMKDLLGEMANTISGNARTEFGPNFIIAPPKIVDGAPNSTMFPKNRQSYITPINWRGYQAVIGICIA